MKCVCLSNQKCHIRPTIINLHPNEYTEGPHYYPFAVNLDRCVGDCNTINDLSNKVFVRKKAEDLVENVIQVKKRNNDKCQCECKKQHICEKDYI